MMINFDFYDAGLLPQQWGDEGQFDQHSPHCVCLAFTVQLICAKIIWGALQKIQTRSLKHVLRPNKKHQTTA